MKIKIYAIGHLKEAYLKQGINEYLERLKPYTQIEIIEVNDESIVDNPSLKDIEMAKNKEGQKVIKLLKNNEYLIGLDLVKNPTYLIIESNHDIKMLLNTNRPFELKNRIMSDVGHLCNEDSAIAAVSIIGEHTKEVVLAHLSEEANTPEVAIEAYQKIFNHFGVSFEKYLIRCAKQRESLTGGDYHEN